MHKSRGFPHVLPFELLKVPENYRGQFKFLKLSDNPLILFFGQQPIRNGKEDVVLLAHMITKKVDQASRKVRELFSIFCMEAIFETVDK